MKDGKYNEAVYLPKLNIRDVDVQLRYSYHAIHAAEGYELPADVNLSKCDIVEMEVVGGKIYKVVARTRYSAEYDLVLVILLETLLVKTVWYNRRSDKHRTLRNKHQFIQKG